MTDAVQDFVARQPHINKRRRILHPMLHGLKSLIIKTDITGLENIPDTGATILMMNHVSAIDPGILTAIIKNRYVISMAKAETLDHWFLRGLVHLWGNFVIKRGEVDRIALNNAIDLLNYNQLVLMAPEGTRNPDGLEYAKSGIAYIAYKTNAIIVPTAICGIQSWSKRLIRFRRAYARINIGQPFRFRLSDNQRLTRPIREQMTQEAMYRLATAIPDEYASQRGVYSELKLATKQYLDFL